MTVIAIDGPSGTGKSTAAKRLAERLGFTYYDTGAMYRAITWLALKLDLDVSDPDSRSQLIATFDFRVDGHRFFVGDEEVTEAIRSQEVTQAVSEVSAHPDIRVACVAVQQEAGRRGNIVVEGRDIGTVVFPDAAHKFFLTARPEIRAARRHAQLKAPKMTEAEILADQERRDTYDSTREHSPLKPAEDAIEIDTSDLTLEEVVTTLYNKVNER